MNTGLFTAAAALHPAADGYALAYGSHATRPRPTSDLDLLYTGSEPLPEARLARLIDGVKQLHGDHGLSLDEEVSFTSKLYATTREIEHAAHLGGFDGITAYATPVGDSATLNSPAFKLRLVLNALTSPHVFLTGDIQTYRRHVAAAERGCALLALRITGAGRLTLVTALRALLSSAEGLTEKHFLGYRHEPHLHAVLRRGFAHLAHDGQVHIHHDMITRRAT
ncbi:nucleotidyltransferase domain-containing protein [Streptomyces sp. NPDC016459]|uniref:nucleotidyltransferase domain-containing protein n=1 Tax=Streptomyces sp. NPDC016459 TaxID=3157190 RepID=UPI00340EC238